MATVVSGVTGVPSTTPRAVPGAAPVGTPRSGSTFIGAPPAAPGAAPAPGAPAAPTGMSQQDQMGAFGISAEEEERRRQATGVSAGGSGYVSGQAPPTANGGALAALGAIGQTPRNETQTHLTGPASPSVGSVSQGVAGASAGWGYRGDRAPPGSPGNPARGPALAGDTTTVQSALTGPAPAPAPTGTPRGAMPATAPPPAGDVSTRTGAITTPTGNTTGTTPGQTPVPTGGSASPTVHVLNEVSPGLGDKLDPGSKLVDKYLKPTLADLTPALASQQAAFGIQDKLDQERYDYRPGEAAAQDRVALEKANSDELRARQMHQLDALEAAAGGKVPSAAELQLQQQSGRNIAATLGQARALGGRSAGGAARAGTLASADILAKTNLDAAATRAVEQDRSRQLLAQTNQGIRGQDVDVATQDARLAQEANQNNLRSQIEQNELAERHRQMLLDEQMKALGIGAGSGNAAVAASGANAAADNKFKGGLMDMAGAAFGM